MFCDKQRIDVLNGKTKQKHKKKNQIKKQCKNIKNFKKNLKNGYMLFKMCIFENSCESISVLLVSSLIKLKTNGNCYFIIGML